jgi:hypothetical protein
MALPISLIGWFRAATIQGAGELASLQRTLALFAPFLTVAVIAWLMCSASTARRRIFVLVALGSVWLIYIGLDMLETILGMERMPVY